MGSSMRRLGVLHRGLERFARGELERHFRRIDVVIRAVVDRALEIHHRESGQKAVRGRFHDSLFNGGNEIARDGAAENFVGELEFPAARQRLHANPAIAELAVAAGLLLVAALHVGLAANGFAIRNLRRVQLHIHAVALLQAADDHFHVLLPAAGQQKLLGLRIAIEAQRLIFFQNPLDRVAHAIFVLAASWRRWRTRWKARASCTGGIGDERRLVVQRVAGQRFLELRHGADVAGMHFGDRLDGFAVQRSRCAPDARSRRVRAFTRLASFLITPEITLK